MSDAARSTDDGRERVGAPGLGAAADAPPAAAPERDREDDREDEEDEGEPWELHRPPIGARPGTLAIPPDAVEPRLRLVRYDLDAVTDEEVSLERALEVLRAIAAVRAADRRGVLWLDVQGLGDEAVLRALGDALGLHPLSLEDVVHTHQRPKVDSFDHHLIVFTRGIDPEGGAPHEQLAFVLRRGVLVTFQEAYGDSFDPVRARIHLAQGRVRNAGADYLAYALLDATVDAYFPAVEALGDALEALEDEALDDPSRDTVRRINELRSDLVHLRRAAWPLRDVFATLLREDTHLVDASVKTFLRDVQDHALHLSELIELQREAASGLMNTYLSSVANRQNEVMKVLTLITSIFIPLSFLAGVYGMNFRVMPELEWRWGYPVLMAVMGALGVGMLLYFRARGWLPPLRPGRRARD